MGAVLCQPLFVCEHQLPMRLPWSKRSHHSPADPLSAGPKPTPGKLGSERFCGLVDVLIVRNSRRWLVHNVIEFSKII